MRVLLTVTLIFKGLLETQPLQETDEETITDVDFTDMISEEEKEELKIELAKVMLFGPLDINMSTF